jgi:hypothetical protein
MVWIGLVIGVVGYLGTMGSVIETTVVPRGTRSRTTRLVAAAVGRTFQFIADRFEAWERRDRVWTLGAPTFLLSLLVAWLLLLLGELTLILLPFEHSSLRDAFLGAGSALFTLGLAAPQHVAPMAFVFVGAASGLIVVALQIAYLPSIYGSFNRREVQVTILDALGGSPAWGPEVLTRFALIGSVDAMGPLYERWTEWAADVSESHIAYRSLIYFRSPAPTRSWVISLLAMLDAAALHLAMCPDTAPRSARRFLRVGYRCVQELAASSRLDTSFGAGTPSDLTADDIIAAFAQVEAAGVAMEQPVDEAVEDFQGWRVNYECPAYALATHIDAVPALWSGPRRRRGASIPPLRPDRAGLE